MTEFTEVRNSKTQACMCREQWCSNSVWRRQSGASGLSTAQHSTSCIWGLMRDASVAPSQAPSVSDALLVLIMLLLLLHLHLLLCACRSAA